MLPQLILLLGLLIAVWMVFNWFSRTKPAVAARAVKTLAFGLVALAGVWLVLTGKLAGLLAVAAGLAPWVMRGLKLHAVWRTLRQFGIRMQGGRPSAGKASEVETRFLRMVLDHDSGELDGEVLEGPYRGMRLSGLSRVQAEELWRQVRTDPESARVLAAWLDRAWPDWREEPAEEAAAPGKPGMTQDEARAILGVGPDATPDEIRLAHRRLMQANHPDRGGSTWIAARINQARDRLLG